MAKRETGTVKWFDRKKGYGFITREKGEDLFVHFRAIQSEGRRSLRAGEAVEFVVVEGSGKVQAEEVTVAGEAVAPRPKKAQTSQSVAQPSAGMGRPLLIGLLYLFVDAGTTVLVLQAKTGELQLTSEFLMLPFMVTFVRTLLVIGGLISVQSGVLKQLR